MASPWAKWLLAGKQVILKSDFLDLWYGISGQTAVRLHPPLIWVSTSTVKIAATPDCVASMQFNGILNILNPSLQVSGGLSDGIARSVAADTSMIFGSGGLYGTTQMEKPSQWYAVLATAGNADTDFVLKAVPFMRVKSQTSQVISMGTLTTPATGIGYGFTTDELIGAMVYVLSGASKGLMRAVIHNNNNDATGGTIEYSGAAISLTAGDWFIILPPTNFRWVGDIFNNSSGDIDGFLQENDCINWNAAAGNELTGGTGLKENILIASPLAIEAKVTLTQVGDFPLIGPPLLTTLGYDTNAVAASSGTQRTTVSTMIKNCSYKILTDTIFRVGYRMPS